MGRDGGTGDSSVGGPGGCSNVAGDSIVSVTAGSPGNDKGSCSSFLWNA